MTSDPQVAAKKALATRERIAEWSAEFDARQAEWDRQLAHLGYNAFSSLTAKFDARHAQLVEECGYDPMQENR